MALHRFAFLAALLCGGMLYVAYDGWLAGMAMGVILGFPLVSLLLSLPGLFTFRLDIQGDTLLNMGDEGELYLIGTTPCPMLPFRGRLKLRNLISGEVIPYDPNPGLPTAHCGGYTVIVKKARVCDYLGLMAFPVRWKGTRQVLVRPKALPVPDFPDVSRFIPRVWKPKFGGGFGENHELRLYRPGDNLNQIHWKLSAKTGKLTIREPMEPQQGTLLLTMTLRGTPEELDRKFGRLLWAGKYLTDRELTYEIQVLTGEGIQHFQISALCDLENAIDTLLLAPAAQSGFLEEPPRPASWQYHIGGSPDEN